MCFSICCWRLWGLPDYTSTGHDFAALQNVLGAEGAFLLMEVRTSYVFLLDFEFDFFNFWMWSYSYFEKNWSSNYVEVPKPTKGKTSRWCVLAWVSWYLVELANLSPLGNFVGVIETPQD